MSRHQHLYTAKPADEDVKDIHTLSPHVVHELRPPQTKRIYSLANLITIFRIGLVPLIIYYLLTEQFSLAFGGFFVAAASDALDGFLARTLSLRTRLGEILDPFADKCLLISIFAAFAFMGEVPLWLAGAIITRDLLIMGAVGWAVARDIVIPIHPTLISKINTFFEVTLACLVLCRLSELVQLSLLEESFYALVLITLLLSSLHYIRIATRLFKAQ